MVFSGVVNSRSFPSCQKKAWKMSILIIRTFDLGDRWAASGSGWLVSSISRAPLIIWAWPEKSSENGLFWRKVAIGTEYVQYKASKQAKRGECLPCERLVQGKRHVGKKPLLARHLIALLRSQKLIRIFSIFTSSKFRSLKSRDEIYQKYLEY